MIPLADFASALVATLSPTGLVVRLHAPEPLEDDDDDDEGERPIGDPDESEEGDDEEDDDDEEEDEEPWQVR